MDRQTRRWAGCGLMIVMATSGCRSTRSEVPPGRKYSGDGRQVPSVGFSSDPRPSGANGMGSVPGGPGTMPGRYGTPSPATPNYGVPTGNDYGPPGQSPGGSGPEAPSLFPESSTAPPPVEAPSANPVGVMGQPGQPASSR